jgi:arabinogalactan oligomer / maltooligosaccharide transport system substrate-binding protein
LAIGKGYKIRRAILVILARFLWFRWGWIALLLPALLAGCGGSRSNEMASMGSTISVMVEEENVAAPLNRIASKKMLKEEIFEFERYNPGTQVILEVVSSDELQQRLQYRASRGLAPDLLLLVGNDLLPLKKKGYISPVKLSAQEQQNFRPVELRQLQNNGEQLGLPLYLYTRLACYDNKRLPRPPQSLAELIKLGQQGHSIGLDASLPSLQWVYSGFGGNLFPGPGESFDRELLSNFLGWLRLANLQPNITFVPTSAQLSQGLSDGNFEWVSCSTRWLPSLRKELGSRLGLSLLPAGPKGAAKPILLLRTWAFGAQSSDHQRRLASQLVAFSSNVVQQRNIALKLGTVVPVNPGIKLPLKAYPTLGLIDQAVRSSRRLNLAQENQLRALGQPSQALIDQVLSGARPPEQIAPLLEALIKKAQVEVQQ